MNGREFRSHYGEGGQPPISGHPSLTHSHDELYQTSNTSPDGFTHTLATPDAQLYGPIRPAQLWRAPWWADGPDGPDVPAEPAPGPLTAEELRDWVLGADGSSTLTALHSAVERAVVGGRRVVLVTPDAEVAVRWIAAATLLLPQERALDLAFSVFASAPEAQVLAVPKPGAFPDAVVFDLSAELPDVQLTGSATHWVPRFLSADPVEVVDAIELAHQFARARAEPRADRADRLAAGLIVLGEHLSPADCGPLVPWLRDAPTPSKADVRGAVLSAVLAAEPPREVLVELAESLEEHAGRIRIALLRSEIDEILHGEAVTEPQPLSGPPWTQDEAEQARLVLESAAAVAAPERMDLLLRTATRFGVPMRSSGFPDAADRFVRWWADHPGVAVDPDRWPCRGELLDRLRALLSHRLETPEADNVRRDVRADWWRLLVQDALDPRCPLDAVVAGAAVAAGGRDREEIVRSLADRVREPDEGMPEAVFDALFAACRPTVDELHQLVVAMPATAVSESVAQRYFSALQRHEVTATYLDVLRMLGHHLGERGRLRELWTEDGRVRSWLAGYPRRGAEPGVLAGISEPVLAARAGEVLDVLRAVDVAEALRVVDEAGSGLQQVLTEALPQIWADEQAEAAERDRAVALAFLTAWQDSASIEVRKAFDQALERWVGEQDRTRHRRVSRVLRGVGAEYATAWHEWLRKVTAGSRPEAPERGRFGRRKRR